MKKEMLSLNSWIKEAAEWQQPLDEFLIDYNMRELECSRRFVGENAGNAGRYGEISRAWVNRCPLAQRSDRR